MVPSQKLFFRVDEEAVNELIDNGQVQATSGSMLRNQSNEGDTKEKI